MSVRKEFPKASLIIATRNEKNTITNCIDAVINQNYPIKKMEILVVDSCSNDDTLRKIEEIKKRSKISIKILTNEKIIQSSAWNIGIRESSGDIVLIVSAHSYIQKDYVQKCVSYLQKTGADNVGGPMIAIGEGLVGKTIEFAHHTNFGLGGGKFHDKNFSGYVDTVYLGAWPRKLFNEVGGFDERLVRNQDIEFNARIRKNGGRVFLSSEIKSYYHCRNSLKGLWKQNYKNGMWVVYTKMIAPYCLSWRHFVPLLFVVSLVVSGVMSFVGHQFDLEKLFALCSLLFAAIAVSYTIANLLFSILISIKKGLKYLPGLTIVFATLHFSYGFGSIFGLITVPAWYRKNKYRLPWNVGAFIRQN